MSKVWDHPIQAIIFDNDGTLLDTIGAYRESTAVILGHDYTDEFHKSINGLRALDVAERCVKEYNLKMTPQEFLDKRAVVVNEKLANAKAFPGAFDLVQRLKSKGYKIGLATSCGRDLTELKYSNHQEFYQLFDVVVCGDEVKHAKPSPEIFLTCAAKLGNIPSENVLVVEDAENGVKAANEANMAVALFANGNDEHMHDSYNAKPSYVFNTFLEFDDSVFNWA